MFEGSELEDCSKHGKKVDAMTLIKEDMSIFGHCPAHDDFYLVVCNHCGQVIKPQAFQKHCERRHGSLSKLYGRTVNSSRSQKHHALNGQSTACGSSKSSRDKSQSSRVKSSQQERLESMPKDNMCLLMPVVNLEKIASLPKPETPGFKVSSKPSTPQPVCSKEAPPLKLPQPLKLTPTPSPKEPTVLPKAAVEISAELLAPVKLAANASPAMDIHCRKIESSPVPHEKDQKDANCANGVKHLPKPSKRISRKECDLNRQCGVQNPETKKICTRLLTCKTIHRLRRLFRFGVDLGMVVSVFGASALLVLIILNVQTAHN